jgi:hypothetical protein
MGITPPSLIAAFGDNQTAGGGNGDRPAHSTSAATQASEALSGDRDESAAFATVCC